MKVSDLIMDNCILYELLVYSEWKEEPELKCNRQAEDAKSVTGVVFRYLKSAFRTVTNKETHDDSIFRLVNSQLPWQFAVGEKGKVVAIMQNEILEIRTSRDEYSSVVGKAAIPKDPYPQWRKLAWSPDCSMLACAQSNGMVGFYDLLGSNIFNIYPAKYNDQMIFTDTKHALVCVIFLEGRLKSPKWSYELITVDGMGNLKSYLVSPMDGYQENHSFSFSRSYIGGVTDVVYHAPHNLLYVVGSSNILGINQQQDQGSRMGISAWRVLNDHPFYKLSKSVSDEDSDSSHHIMQNTVWSWIPYIFKKKQSDIFKMQISPLGQYMVCLHTSGSISIWLLPSIRLYRFWKLNSQPNYDVKNNDFLDQRRRNFFSVSESILFHPVDVNWWSEEAIIIARYSGSISVCSINDLQNLLGDLPEFFDGQPRVSSMCDKGFLGLECVCMVSSIKKRLLEDEQSWEELSFSAESSEDEDGSLFKKGSSLIKTGIYWVTDSEKFQPKRKKPKLVRRIYRLLGLKSTTPEELYARKIDNEEYGEALALARAYNLDCDLVYQRQWRNSNVTIATIHDYLSKVTKRSWVLKECVGRVPDTLVAAEKLLEYGLQETSLDIVDFLVEGYQELEADPSNSPKKVDMQKTNVKLLPIDETVTLTIEEKWENYLQAKVKEYISKDELREVIEYRRIILQYMDRLSTYKIILADPRNHENQYNASFYEKFRSVPVMITTLEFARQGNSASVESMFTYHGNDILDHWLVILSNFPETTNPYEYSSLLPECDPDGKVFSWDHKLIRNKDWSEADDIKEGEDKYQPKVSNFIFEEGDSLMKFVSDCLTSDMLTAWYTERACQIELRCKMVDYAITLVKMGRERNVKGLESLQSELLTLETLVYEAGFEEISLSDLQKKNSLEKAKLLMQKSTESTFVHDIKCLLLPFLVRSEKECKGSLKKLLHDYLIDLSSRDLRLPLQLFKYFSTEQPASLVSSLDEVTSLALDCLYSYPGADQLDIAFKILECLPERGFGSQSHQSIELHERVDELESHLSCAEIFQRNGILMPLTYIRQVQYDHDTVYGLILKLSRSIIKKSLSATQVEWNYLLNDILDLQSKAFSIIDFETCIEIYVSALLSSGLGANIKNASEYLQCSKEMGSNKRVSYDKSVQLILKSSREYFDSSSDIYDPSMNLAKSCLQLILDQNDEIEEELDLIEALHILTEFGVRMLPLQVRLFRNRLKLVENCLHSNVDAYKRSVSLLKLAKTLRVEGEDHRLRDGKVLSLIAESALEAKDFKCCAKICQNIMDQSYSNGWEIAQRLGQCLEFRDTKLRMKLISFALLHCDANMIENLVKIRSRTEVQVLSECIGSKFAKEKSPDNTTKNRTESNDLQKDENLNQSMLYQTLSMSAESIKEKTNMLMKNLGSESMWKSTLSWLRPIQDYKTAVDNNSLNEDFSLQGFHSFYASLHTDFYISVLGSKYNKYSSPDLSNTSLELLQILSRIAWLEQSINEGAENRINTDVIIKLSELLLPEDCVLGIAHLLALNNTELADSCFSRLKTKTEVSLQLAMLYYCLQIIISVTPTERRHEVYLHDPNKLIQYVFGLKNNLSTSNEYYMDRLDKYHGLLVDYLQERQLSALGYGVHLQRFNNDSTYQQDTIVGLALTDDRAAFQFALDLASRHHVPEEKLVAAYVSTIFLSDRISLEELKSRLSDPKLVEKMKASPDGVVNSLNVYVYPMLNGKDYDKLHFYFNTLDKLMENNERLKFNIEDMTLSPQEHLKLLNNVIATNSGIDYKNLIKNPNDVLDAVSSVLTIDNLESIAHLLKSLPPSLKCSVHIGNLYGLWVKTYFFQEMGDETQSLGQEVKWEEKFQQCKAYFYKMLPYDILDFVREACFSEQSHKLLTVECRKWMINSTESFCKLQCSMNDWSIVANEISKWKMHLKKLSSKAALEVYEKGSKDLQTFLRMLDLAHVNNEKVLETFKMAVCSQEPFSSIEFLLSLSVAEILQPMSCLLEEFLKLAVDKYCCLERSSDSSHESDTLLFVESILKRLQEGFDNGVLFETNSSLWNDLQRLCANTKLVPALRLQALKLIQEHYIHEQCDKKNTEELGKTLQLYETQAIVAKSWPDIEVKLSDLEEEDSRLMLFDKLLKISTDWSQALCLTAILARWPKFQPMTPSSKGTNPWVLIVKNIKRFNGLKDDDIYNFLELLFGNEILSDQDITNAVAELESWNDYPVLVHSLLLLNGTEFHEKAINIILNNSQVAELKLKQNTLSLIIKKKLATQIVGSKIFNDCVQQILDCKEENIPLINELINELKISGKEIEAGILSLQAKYVPVSLQVFSSALSVVSQD